ncbi:MAG TPA: FHA domain-containing protein [Sporichthyaceae bacterium]|nr:FHA domain-containing protein [Sporichthyaceae bacterium]
MSELTITVIRLGFLAVLWLFVLTTISVMRSDMGGPRTSTTRPTIAPAARQTKPPKQPRGRRTTPTKLVVTAGALTGTSVTLSDVAITLGRAPDSTVVLDDDYASNRHARVFPSNGEWLVEDLGSTNGTYLDRQKLQGPTPVPIGTPIRIGKTAFELRK